MINVSKPFLPPQVEYEMALKEIWRRGWLTNNGPLVNELELKLKEFLGVNHLLYLSNGTIALQIAIRSLGLKGDIITTPFSFVATTSSIVWESCKPVFVDIQADTMNIDPTKIEAAITPKTTAILATHVYGNPCEIDAIATIAAKHKLKVIYDAAHCFGTTYKGKSVFNYGDVSTTSFHATKIFHTVEGGGVVSQDPEVVRQMALIRNFGFNGPENFDCVGINAKNSELHALMGLINLRYADEVMDKRKRQSLLYSEKLGGLNVQKLKLTPQSGFNYAYYPIIFPTEEDLLKAVKMLNTHWIYPRRYFYPSLNTISYTKNQPCPVSEDMAQRVLCLPLYHELTEEEISFICRLLLRSQNN